MKYIISVLFGCLLSCIVGAQQPDTLLSPSERYQRDTALAGRQLARFNIPYKKVVWLRDYSFICFEQTDGKLGLMNFQGSIIQPADCAAIHINAHDCFIVKDFVTGKRGLIDASGQVLIPRKLDDCEEVTDYYGAPITGFLYRDAYGFRNAEEALEEARAIGLLEDRTLVGSATNRYGVHLWIDNLGNEHPIRN